VASLCCRRIARGRRACYCLNVEQGAPGSGSVADSLPQSSRRVKELSGVLFCVIRVAAKRCGMIHLAAWMCTAAIHAIGHPMPISRHIKILLLIVAVTGVSFSSASSRPWKPSPAQLAGDYAQINHGKSSNEFVNIRWWAAPTVASGTPFARMLEKYVVISIVHFHTGQGGAISTDDIETLEVRNEDDKALTLVPRTELLPTEIGMITTLQAGFRQSSGRIGDGTKFFIFDAGSVRACEKGKVSVPYAGETYTWETPFPGCLQ